MVFLVSDVHYTDFVGGGSLAVSDVLGKTQTERLSYLNDCLSASPNTPVLILGDISVDDAPWRKNSFGKDNYCLKYKREFMDRLPNPCFILPGNHDSYTDEEWQQMFATPRQSVAVFGDDVYLLLDTFHGTASGASGSPYTGVDTAFLTENLAKYRGKRIYLCSHYFDFRRESVDFAKILCENSDIVALFHGHTHVRELTQTPVPFGRKPIYNTGGFSYNCYCYKDEAGVMRWDFNHYDASSAWGYLCHFPETHTADYIYVAATYRGTNGVFVHPQEILHESF